MHNASKGDVWIINLPEGVGHEQKGKRPAVVVVHIKQNFMAVVIPLTGELDKETFSFTHCIQATAENGLAEESVAMVFQLRSLDVSRFIEKKGRLSKEDMGKLDAIMKDMLKIG